MKKIYNARHEIEEKFWEWARVHILEIVTIIVTILAIVMRISNLNFVSIDMEESLLDWYKKMVENNRIYGLYHQIGDYNIPYQAILAILTYLPFKPIYMIKAVPSIFDFCLAILAGVCCDELLKENVEKGKRKLCSCMIYMLVLIIPSVYIDSSIWGQSDSIYASFVIAAVICLKKSRNFGAFVLMGIAFSLKLQSLFVIPFFIYYMIVNRKGKISIFHFLIIPITDWIICLPVMVKRNNLLETFDIYFGQLNEYEEMYMNYPSFWMFVGDMHSALSFIAICTTVAVFGIGLLLLIRSRINIDDSGHFIAVLCWTVWTAVEFLPAMHERYGFVLIPLTIVLAFVNRRYLFPVLLLQFVSINTYADYVFWNGCNYMVMAALNLLGYLCLTAICYLDIKRFSEKCE